MESLKSSVGEMSGPQLPPLLMTELELGTSPLISLPQQLLGKPRMGFPVAGVDWESNQRSLLKLTLRLPQ